MANYWAIAIGINQYKQFQPLTYAERDAQELRNFLVFEAGFPSENCLLLVDSAAGGGNPPSAPDRHHIQSYIAQLCQNQVQPDDFLWVFFSGYGIQFQGKDYLMPIEGDPTDVISSGISMDTLFGLFRSAPTSNILLVLDMNRSQGTLSIEGAGANTLELAEAYGIPTLLSCTPNQFSNETLGLRLGLFTAALLEGLRNYGCTTLEHLRQHMSDRLPQLCDHHWRPRQDPAVVIPPEKRYQLILPGKTSIPDITVPGEIIEEPQQPEEPDTGGEIVEPPVNPPPDPEKPVPPVEPPPPIPPDPIDEGAWERLLKWAAVLGTGLVMLVLLRNLGTVTQTPVAQPNSSPSGGTGIVPVPPEGSPAPVISPIPASPLPTPTETVTPVGVNPLPLPGTPETGIAPWGTTNPSEPVVTNPTTSDGQSQPIASLQPLPSTVPGDGQSGSGGGQAPQGVASPPAENAGKQPDRAILDEALATLSRWRADAPSNQVTEIADAIQKVRQIQPNQPLYQEAQQVIDRWSNMIFDMAVGRAERRNGGDSLVAAQNYHSAIAAARLVPPDRVAVYRASQDAIAFWSQKILELANARASEGYLDLAIQVGQQVPLNTPVYGDAQEAIVSWQGQKQAGILSR